jgi:hypothetical protein
MVTISFKVSEDEARAIRAKARQARLSVSEFLRRQAAAPCRQAPNVTLGRCEMTGAMIFDAGAGLAPLTVEATRELLADFP